MGAGHLDAAVPSEFTSAGRVLFSFGLIKGSEGNLSFWDGRRVLVTRTSCELGSLVPGDVLEGTLDEPPAQASSDMAIHLGFYAERGPGAVAHAHPPGTVPADWVEGANHGSYSWAATLGESVEALVAGARARAGAKARE